MTTRAHYTSAAGVDTVLDTVRFGAIAGLVTKADQGTVGMSSLDVPDHDGSIAIRGLKRLYVEDDACVSAGVLWNGYIGTRDVDRGDFVTGSARTLHVSLVDLNTLLENYIIQDTATPANCKRPAEPDFVRVQWLLSTFLPQVHDHGCVATTQGAMMDACDYTGQTAGDVLRDCGTKSGRQWFVYYDEAWTTDSHKDALFYDDPRSESFTSTLQFSNVPGDADDVTTFEMCSDPQPTQHRSPDRVMSGVYQTYNGGAVMRRDTDVNLDTHNTYYVREKVGASSNTTSADTARDLADRQLLENGSEEDTCSFSVLLPRDKAGLVQAGHRILCRFEHFEPEYRAFTWWRIDSLALHQDDPETHDYYRLDIEASPAPPLVVHQVVLANMGYQGAGVAQMTPGAAPVPCYFGGTCGPVSLAMSAIACDTDAYATPYAVADAAASTAGPYPGYGVAKAVIPAGLGGTYRATWETFQESLGWYNPGLWLGATVTGTGVSYVPCGSPTSSAYGLYSAGSVLTLSLCVNGVPVHTETAPANDFYTRASFLVHFDDGDEVTLQASWTGTVLYMDAPVNAIGIGPYGTQQGLLALVRLAA